MSRPAKEIFSRLGDAGLARVLDDLLDQNVLVRVANTCGLKYPGMRMRSQKRQRILTDLQKQAGEQEATRKAILRTLEKETRAASREWTDLSEAEQTSRLKDERLLKANGKLGLHLFLLARGTDDGLETHIRRLLARRTGRAAPKPGPTPRGESRLLKKITEMEKKVRHLDGQILKAREVARLSKRDVIQRKGELAESRMRAERLQHQLNKAQAAGKQARAPSPTEPAAATNVESLVKVVRKLAAQQTKLAHEIEKRSDGAKPSRLFNREALAPLEGGLKDLQKEIGGFKREYRKRLQEQAGRLDELRAEIEKQRKAAARAPRRSRAKGESARVGVFIDVQNMYYAARRLKGKLDFDALLVAAVLDRRLIQATAYVVESKEIDQSGFIAMLQQRAIDVRRKNLRVRADGSMKGDWDMELALEVLDAAPRLDVVVLVSGDGDFTSLVKRVKGMGPRVEVMGFPRNTAKSLLEAADEFHALDRKFMIHPPRSKGDKSPEAPSGKASNRPHSVPAAKAPASGEAHAAAAAKT